MTVATWQWGITEQRDGEQVGEVARRRRYARIVKDLRLPRRLTIDRLCQIVGSHLGSPIQLRRVEMPPDLPSGVVVVTPNVLGVFVDALAQPWLQDGIACHELAHLLLGHHLTPLTDTDATQRILPTIEPWAVEQALTAPVERTLARTCYDGVPEREAEVLGTEMFGHLNPWPAEQTWDVPAQAAHVIRNIERALGDGAARE
ncbi:hypothetical protein HC031_19675 [Planosporangium thailandense]|uniref:IrrE N-terminal-like domain-containing protein n=1 Tax=Planosporangium thailandense TaxID=765197 RepID=A0ABX0Y3A4_9ACTN|nr:hypothetical protein [Planosporangium thailandense]NJC71918.1 hypothetical protein [Planosporangium thailandense]